MAPRALPPVALPILSPTQMAPKFRPLPASPSRHSLSHFGASHSAALSSLAAACAETAVAMAPAKTAASLTDLRNQDIRDGPRLTTRIDYLRMPIRPMISQAANEASSIRADAHRNAVSRSANGGNDQAQTAQNLPPAPTIVEPPPT